MTDDSSDILFAVYDIRSSLLDAIGRTCAVLFICNPPQSYQAYASELLLAFVLAVNSPLINRS